MRRAKRQSACRGNITGRQRRRMAALLRRATRPNWAPGAFVRGAGVRVARRLAEAGLAVAVVTKWRPWRRQPLAEVCVFATMVEALARYPRGAVLPGRRR
mgnify:CR=1 FL=1